MIIALAFAALLLSACADPQFSNPYDEKGSNYIGGTQSSSSNEVANTSSSSSAQSSSSNAVANASSSSSAQSSSSSEVANASSSSSAQSSSSRAPSEAIVNGESVTYEGETYPTVVIGGQTWFAKNLNYETGASKCYNDKPENCTKYGRLYNWETANAACPQDWRLPSQEDWNNLSNSVGGSATEGEHLKATSGWSGSNGNGKDTYGFAAMPGGGGYTGNTFSYAEQYGYWWSSTENGASNAYYRDMGYYTKEASWKSNIKSYFFSVRCMRDD